MLKIIFLIGLFINFYSVSADENIEQKAAQLYQNQEWSEAANAYEQLVSKEDENHTAWYRLANSYIQLKHGEKALSALIKASASQQIPRSLIHYQNAQAYYLVADKDSMWQELSLAASTGYSMVSALEEGEIWNKVREDDRFKKIMSVVDKNKRPCMYDEKMNQFDFWIGEWEVYTDLNKASPIAGTNKIEKLHDGCLLMENWISAAGNPGTSMNYYDGTKQKWVQHWVSTGGVVINLEGGLENGSMLLTGNIYYQQIQGANLRELRGTWTPLENGVVRQYFEESIDSGKTWYPWFEGFYFPKIQEKEIRQQENNSEEPQL
jgi:tetratricopeptide (TPR) repeat protein